MKVKHGRLLTADRLRILDDYKRRRYWSVEYNCRMPRDQWERARAWVNDFERFMCAGWNGDLNRYRSKRRHKRRVPNGITKPKADANQDGARVHAPSAAVDNRGPAVDAA